MRALIQRVKKAHVAIDGQISGEIGKGFLVFVAVHKDDSLEDIEKLVPKLLHMRIFPDERGKFHYNIQDIEGEVLIISQFTLYGNCRKGRRPDFFTSAQGEKAEAFHDLFIEKVREEMQKVQTGVFGASMEVSLVNDGPVTLMIDSRE